MTKRPLTIAVMLDVRGLVSRSKFPKQTGGAVSRVVSWMRFRRDSFPGRGVFSRDVLRTKTVMFYKQLLRELFAFIEENPKPGSEWILEFEKFQSSQKGPVGPIKTSDFVAHTVVPYKSFQGKYLSNQPLYDKIGERIFSFFAPEVQYKIEDINFLDSWGELPSSTIRGGPYNGKGKQMDDYIVKEVGGPDGVNAGKFSSSYNDNYCFPGLRLQGKPWGTGAKSRVVIIPSVYYQFVNVGLYKASMRHLKQFNCFLGGSDPRTRDERMRENFEKAKAMGMSYIALDFSKFDTTISIDQRVRANQLMGKIIRLPQEYFEGMKDMIKNQGLLLPTGSGDTQLYDISGILPSGVINTQQDGSLVNLFVQQLIAEKLGFSLPIDLSLCLGDDVGIPIPDSLLQDVGYQGLLTRIKDIVGEIGMVIHDKKAYPSPTLVFLQRLYKNDDVGNIGSGARSMASFFGQEKYPKKIPGVKDLRALHVVSQITILTNAYSESKTNYNEFGQKFCEGWLKYDDFLRYLVFKTRKAGGNGDTLFTLLIRLAGGATNILDNLDLLSYDHTGLKEKLNGGHFMKLFPIVEQLMNVPVRETPPPKGRLSSVEVLLDELVEDEE